MCETSHDKTIFVCRNCGAQAHAGVCLEADSLVRIKCPQCGEEVEVKTLPQLLHHLSVNGICASFPTEEVKSDILSVCADLYTMLKDKNEKYGNSALDPIRVFSHADTLEQIKVRMDEKLSRIRNQRLDDDEDAYKDLAGYLVLYLVARKRSQQEASK